MNESVLLHTRRRLLAGMTIGTAALGRTRPFQHSWPLRRRTHSHAAPDGGTVLSGPPTTRHGQ